MNQRQRQEQALSMGNRAVERFPGQARSVVQREQHQRAPLAAEVIQHVAHGTVPWIVALAIAVAAFAMNTKFQEVLMGNTAPKLI